MEEKLERIIELACLLATTIVFSKLLEKHRTITTLG